MPSRPILYNSASLYISYVWHAIFLFFKYRNMFLTQHAFQWKSFFSSSVYLNRRLVPLSLCWYICVHISYTLEVIVKLMCCFLHTICFDYIIFAQFRKKLYLGLLLCILEITSNFHIIENGNDYLKDSSKKTYNHYTRKIFPI